MAHRRLILVILPIGSRASALDEWAGAQARRGRLSCLIDRGADPADRRRSWLGTEVGHVYARLPPDVRPSDLAALLGTVRGGCTAVIVLPGEAVRGSVLLRRWLARCLLIGRGDSSIRVMYPTRSCLVRPCPAFAGRRVRTPDRLPRLPRRLSRPAAPSIRFGPPRADVQRQDERYRQAVERLRSDPSACIVILGPRGSGKTALLARLIPVLQALDEGGRAPRLVSAGARRSATLDRWLPGLPIDDVQVLARHDDRTVVIDEAASLPLAVLEGMLERPGRILMASTVDGYESSGRAFAGRFIDQLLARRPAGLLLRTRGRFRFAHDAVHRTLSEAFLLDALGTASGRRLRTPAAGADAALSVERVPPPLSRLESLAWQVVALLGATHYRASLDELDPMLDGRLDVRIVRDAQGRVIAAATLSDEGTLPFDLHADILAGRRRLPDQLLPQLLARSAGDGSALGERYARVTRIAVLPEWRRRGIATRLLQSIRQASPPEIALGASFAQGSAAEAFWQQAGLSVFHRGLRVNPRSGHRSVAVLSGGTARTRAVLERARSVLADNQGIREDVSRDEELLARFADGERGLAETLGPLTRAWRAWLGDDEANVFDAACPLGLPADASGRCLERALARWTGERLSTRTNDNPGKEPRPT